MSCVGELILVLPVFDFRCRRSSKKPCITGLGLGWAARFGSATQTTTEYLPVDERGVRVVASARADWWALAMTLAEKACGAAGLPLGHRARVFTASEVRAHLEAHLPAGVWAALAGHIAPR